MLGKKVMVLTHKVSRFVLPMIADPKKRNSIQVKLTVRLCPAAKFIDSLKNQKLCNLLKWLPKNSN